MGFASSEAPGTYGIISAANGDHDLAVDAGGGPLLVSRLRGSE